MEKPTPTNQNITLRISHPEKERFELCEIECGAGTTLDELKDQICAKTGLQARILVMAKRYEAGGDLDARRRRRRRRASRAAGRPTERQLTLRRAAAGMW